MVVSLATKSQLISMWRVSTGEKLCTLAQLNRNRPALIKLKDGYFVTASQDRTIRVWDEDCSNIATYHTESYIFAMALTAGSIVTHSGETVELRKP